jgi:tetratricopeptide (TPR) repeat protein
MAHFFAGQFEAAIAGCAEALELLPAFVPARFCAGMAAAESGAYDVALDHIAALRRATADNSRRAAAPSATPPSTDATAFWSSRLSRLRAGLAGTDCQCQTLAVAVALAHLGMADDALVLLERAADLRSDSLLFAGVHPALARLHRERRFQRVLERVGLPAAR